MIPNILTLNNILENEYLYLFHQECDRLKKRFHDEISDLRSENRGLKTEIAQLVSRMAEINDDLRNSNRAMKLNDVINNQELLKVGISDIRSNMKILEESVAGLISSFADEVKTMLKTEHVSNEDVSD